MDVPEMAQEWCGLTPEECLEAQEREAELFMLAYDVVVAKMNYEEAFAAYKNALAAQN